MVETITGSFVKREESYLTGKRFFKKLGEGVTPFVFTTKALKRALKACPDLVSKDTVVIPARVTIVNGVEDLLPSRVSEIIEGETCSTTAEFAAMHLQKP